MSVSELVLSSSSADAYNRCGWRFYLEYVEMVPQTQNVRAAIGLAVHAAVEDYYREKLTLSEFSPQEAHGILFSHSGFWSAYVDAYNVVAAFELAAVDDPDEDTEKARASGERTLMAYLEDVAPAIKPLYVEEALRIDVNDIPYSIHPDLIDTEINVRDLKIKTSKPRDPAVYAFQQEGYALGVRVLLGRKEHDLLLDIMIRLKRDRPYYVPIANGGPISDTAVKTFARKLERIANAIARDEYPPTGLETGVCRYCPVRYACQPYEESRRAHEDAEQEPA